MRYILIGDVHGCLSELKQLLAKVSVTVTDRIVFTGDLIMKGPQQAETVRYVRDLAKFNDVTLIRGNHEKKFLNYLHAVKTDPIKAGNMKKAPLLRKLSNDLSLDDIKFLWSSSWFHKFSSGNRDFIAIHGGITPKMEDSQFSEKALSKKDSRRLHQVCHVKYVDPEGGMRAFGSHLEGESFWAEIYDGRFGCAIYGHQAYWNLTEHPHAIGVDLGCVYGNKLCALIIENGKHTHITIDAEKAYSSEGTGPI